MTSQDISELSFDEYRDYLLAYRGTGRTDNAKSKQSIADILNICSYGCEEFKILCAKEKPCGFGKLAVIANEDHDKQKGFCRWYYREQMIGGKMTRKKNINMIDGYMIAHNIGGM